jgi:cytochrome c biogenesis protein CcdA
MGIAIIIFLLIKSKTNNRRKYSRNTSLQASSLFPLGLLITESSDNLYMNYLSKFINYFNSLDSLIFIGVMIIILVFLFIFMMESSTGRNILESRHMESFPNISGIPDDKLLAKLVTQIISRKSGSFQGNIYSPI